MQVLGVDFTSRPTHRKPVTLARCRLDGGSLQFEGLETFADYRGFEARLRVPGPWIAGFDFPFAHARRCIAGLGWPQDWPAYADHLAAMDRAAYRAALEDYKRDRAPGDREHPRGFERGTGAVSPQKLYGVPVALMLFEGVPRLRAAGLNLPGLCPGDPQRIGVEVYPGVLARRLIGRVSYKTDARGPLRTELLAARRAILAALRTPDVARDMGFAIVAPGDLAGPQDGDALDALLCAVQAAWAFRHVLPQPERLARFDPLEGWIADPALFR